MVYAQTIGSSRQGSHFPKNLHIGPKAPNFRSLYHNISINWRDVDINLTDSFLYSPADFNYFFAEISEDPKKITKVVDEVQEYATKVSHLISSNIVELKGPSFRRVHEFTNVLEFYVSKIGDIRKAASKYTEGKKCCVPRRQTVTQIANSLGNLKYLLTELESDVMEFSREHRKIRVPIHKKQRYIS